MGLDMYAYIIEKSFVTSDVDFDVDEGKHPNLHGWMERLYVAKGGQNPEFNLSPVALNNADLDALETAIKAGDLPETSGFFQSDGSEQDDDLEFIRKARKALKDGLAVIYVAWW